MIQFARTLCSLQVQRGGEIMGDPTLPLLLNIIGVFQSARGLESSAEDFLRDADAILQHPPYRQRAIERAIERGEGAGSVTSRILTTRDALYNVCKARGRGAEAERLLQGILLELDAARAVRLQRCNDSNPGLPLCLPLAFPGMTVDPRSSASGDSAARRARCSPL